MPVYVKSLCVKNWRVCQCKTVIPQFPKVDEFPAAHVTLMCLLFGERDLAFPDSQTPSYVTTYLLKEQHCMCPQLFAVTVQRPPHLFYTCSLPCPVCQLRAPGLTPQSWYTLSLLGISFSLLSTWRATSPIKLHLKPGPGHFSNPTLTGTFSEIKPCLQQFVKPWPHPSTPLWWN